MQKIRNEVSTYRRDSHAQHISIVGRERVNLGGSGCIPELDGPERIT